MADTIMNWFQLLTFEQVVKSVVNFQVIETTVPLKFEGVKQALPAQKLWMKPEGQRLWKWYTIHALPTIQLKPDDVIIDQSGMQFRVMERFDFKEYGMVELHIIEDYTGSGPTTP
jgi:hypothetical protein